MSDVADTKPCCQDDKNLSPPKEVREDLVVRVCAVCGCRHFELTVDPLHLRLRAA